MVEGRNVSDNMIIINPRETHLLLVGFKMGLVKIVLFAALFAVGYAEIVESSTCTESNEDLCKVGEVRVVPCEGGKVCNLKKGTNASLAFDFTPNFATSNLKTMVFWASQPDDIPFLGFGSDDACNYTTCPTVPGQAQTVNYHLHVGSKLPKGKYNLKWKVWTVDNADNISELCCFRFSIRLTKEKKH